MKVYALIITAILIIAGCVAAPSEPVSSSESRTTDIADMIEISDVEVFPNPVSPGDTFTLKFVVRNLHDDEPINNLYCYVYDPGIFDLVGGGEEPITLYPKTSMPYQFEFSVKSSSIITNQANVRIGYACRYDAEARSQVIYHVFDKETLDEYQISGNTIESFKDTSESPGPLKISMKLSTDYLIAGKQGKMTVVLEDYGTGLVRAGGRNAVAPGLLHVMLPKDQMGTCSIRQIGPGDFSCHEKSDETGTYCDCVNGEEIRMFDKKSPEIGFLFDVLSDAAPDGRKTYVAKAYLGYTYHVTGEVEVLVKEE